MNSPDFRAEARKKLEGKWGKVAVITLAYVALFFVLGFIQGLFEEGSFMQSILSIATTVIEVPLAFGLIVSLFKVYNSEESKAFDFLSLGFSNFAKSWKISLWIFVKMIVPVILIVISVILIGTSVAIGTSSLLVSGSSGGLVFLVFIGFILYIASLIWAVMLSYYYSIAYIIATDRPELQAKQAVEESKRIMTGNREKLFCLQFSFIGWAILAVFTLGIGYLWLLPYVQFALFAFYKKLVENNNVEVNTKVEDNNPIH